MEKFTASNGLTNLDVILDEYTSEVVDALREFFQHERDQELGRWRWPEDPNYVVYEKKADVTGYQPGVRVVHELTGRSRDVDRRVIETFGPTSRFGEAARAYFAAHPEPKPWHDAKPGEVWAVTWDGHETPCHVVENAISSNGLVFNDGTRETPGVLAPCITHARRIWPE